MNKLMPSPQALPVEKSPSTGLFLIATSTLLIRAAIFVWFEDGGWGVDDDVCDVSDVADCNGSTTDRDQCHKQKCMTSAGLPTSTLVVLSVIPFLIFLMIRYVALRLILRNCVFIQTHCRDTSNEKWFIQNDEFFDGSIFRVSKTSETSDRRRMCREPSQNSSTYCGGWFVSVSQNCKWNPSSLINVNNYSLIQHFGIGELFPCLWYIFVVGRESGKCWRRRRNMMATGNRKWWRIVRVCGLGGKVAKENMQYLLKKIYALCCVKCKKLVFREMQRRRWSFLGVKSCNKQDKTSD